MEGGLPTVPNSLQSSDHTVLPIVIQAGGVQLPAVLNGFRKQFGDLERIGTIINPALEEILMRESVVNCH